MNNKIDGAELTIYLTDGQSISLDLSPMQLMAVHGLLGIEYSNTDNSITCFSDEGLKKFYDKTVGKYKKIG